MNFTLTKIRMVDESDWGLDPDVIAALIKAEDEQTPIEVLCKAVDSDDAAGSYYDIKLADGTTVDAVQGCHILGIEDWQEPGPLTAQYVLALKFNNYKGGSIDHEQIEAILATALNDAMEALIINTGHDVSLESVTFETDYPTPEEN